MATELTRERIEQAFDLMGATAAKRGLVIEIAVYGGSCLVLASDIRNASADVDAVFLTNRSAVYEIADAVARQMGLATNWINEAVKQMAPPVGNPEPNLFPFGEYPRGRQEAVGLRVHVPTPAYLLAMKVLANRLEGDVLKSQSDQDDALALMKITGINSRESILELLKQCYPNIPGMLEPRLNPRISVKIDALMDGYARSRQSLEPSWNARTGLRLVRDDGETLRFCLAGFLDEFYADPDPASRRARVEEAPALTGDVRQDAFFGAIGEHLCRRWELGTPPDWTNDPARFLGQPWFIGHERMKAFLLVESPSAFRRRFIFTEAEPLRRASMPKDGRWWAYETMRTGRLPHPGEVIDP